MTRRYTMFDWFNKPQPPVTIPKITLPEVAPEPRFNDDGYTIGYSDGVTMFKLKAGMNTFTMTLTPDEVYRMIRLLKASLNQDPENETDPPTL